MATHARRATAPAALLLAALAAIPLGAGFATACTTDAECSDGNACNGTETCVGGVCQPGTPLNCHDTNPCTTDSCDPVLGVCQYVALPNGTGCDDGTICNGREVCQGGLCKPGTPLNCDDGIACTADTCDPVAGCLHAPIPDGGSCSDGNACNGLETCLGGVCTPGTPPNCDDGNVCTTDSCVVPTGCKHAPVANGTPCPDGDICNGAETCQAGVCTPGATLNCNDNNPCTLDGCDPLTGCIRSAAVDGTTCSDGQFCNGVETCQGAVCRPGTPLADGTSCTDGDVCNGLETCQSGVCAAGTPLDCDDHDACTDDTCTSPAGCAHSPTVCDDGRGGTVDTCDPAVGCQYATTMPGRLLSLKANPVSAAADRIRVVVKGAAALIDPPAPGGGSDPVTGGASVRVASTAGGFDHTYLLPKGRWQYIGNPAHPLGYRYADGPQFLGPFTKLTVRAGGLLSAVAKGSALGLALPGAPAPVDVVVTLGSTRYCTSFGGSTAFKVDRLFLAKNAPAPASCP
jgi:hypothetical protein